MSSWFFIDTDQNTGFPESSKQWNALVITDYFRNNGWTDNAISGMLGNMDAESFINPCQFEIGFNKSMSAGFGLVQWTPATKYTNWAGSDWRTNFDKQLDRIIYELNNGLQWQGRGAYYNLSFYDYSRSTDDVSTLAEAFLLNYENPRDPSASLAYRQQRARHWYSYITGTPEPPEPPPPTPPTVHLPIWLLFKIRWNNGGK